MYHTIHPLIQVLSLACILLGFALPFFGFWTGPFPNDIFTLHLLSLAGFFSGMLAGYGAALIRDSRRDFRRFRFLS